MKLRDEDLRRELQIALEGRDSQSNCALRLNIHKEDFRRLLSRARIHGIDAVLHCNIPGGYADEFKIKVVHSVVSGGMSKSSAAAKCNLRIGTVHAWVRKYLEGGEERLLSDNRGRTGSMGRKRNPRLEDFKPGSLEYYKFKAEKLERECLLLKKALPLVREMLKDRSQDSSDTGSSEN